jgi:hypothetical protein
MEWRGIGQSYALFAFAGFLGWELLDSRATVRYSGISSSMGNSENRAQSGRQ